jgi:hypothetical protein
MNIDNSLDSQKRFVQIVSFIKEQTRAYNSIITRETLIEDDLGVTGEEASDLIQNFAKKYKIDITEFNFEKYFNDEPSVFTVGKKISPFTVGYLEKAVIAGRLDEEVINS